MPARFEGDPYAILGVPRDASQDAIKEAYRRRAKATHPDVDARPEAMAAMVRINGAYALLSDPARRRAWDALGPAARTAPSTHRGARADAARGPGPAPRAQGPTAGPAARPASPRDGGRGSERPTLEDAEAFRVGTGRYLGMTLGEVAAVDPGYVRWVARRETDRPRYAAAARRVAMHLDELELAATQPSETPGPAEGVRGASGRPAGPRAPSGRDPRAPSVVPGVSRDRLLVVASAMLAALGAFAVALLLFAMLGP